MGYLPLWLLLKKGEVSVFCFPCGASLFMRLNPEKGVTTFVPGKKEAKRVW